MYSIGKAENCGAHINDLNAILDALDTQTYILMID